MNKLTTINNWLTEDEDLRNEIKDFIKKKVEENKKFVRLRKLSERWSNKFFDLPDVYVRWFDYLIELNNKKIKPLYYKLRATTKNPAVKKNDDFERKKAHVKSFVDVRIVINTLTNPKKPQLIGNVTCPFHADGKEKKPSMGIKHNRFRCFTCGENGDSIAFVMKYNDLNFCQAVEFLNKF